MKAKYYRYGLYIVLGIVLSYLSIIYGFGLDYYTGLITGVLLIAINLYKIRFK